MRASKVARDAHARLRASGGHLKGIADWRQIEAEVIAAAVTGITTAEEACLLWMRAMAAVHSCGKGKAMTLTEGAAAITELGLPTFVLPFLPAGIDLGGLYELADRLSEGGVR